MHPNISMHSQNYCNPPCFHISQTCFVSPAQIFVHARCSENRWVGYRSHDVNGRNHQFLAPVVIKQFSTRQQANPLGLHCLEEAQCISGVLPSLFCKYPSKTHCPKRDTIWSGSQVKQDSEISWKWYRTERGDGRLQTSVLRRGRTPRAEPPRPFVLH